MILSQNLIKSLAEKLIEADRLKKEVERWVRDFKRDGYIEDKDFNQDDLAKTKLLD